MMSLIVSDQLTTKAFRRSTHREGDHFHFSQQIFILSRGRGSPGGPADEQLFARRNFPCPAVGLS